MSLPSYTLLLPTLNRPKLVERMLKSVAEQTARPAEIVMIDQSDGPETRELFARWEHPGIRKKYIHRGVKSLILARNAGIDAASADTELMAFFDDDLVLAPDFSEAILRVFERDTERRYGGGMGRIEGWKYKAKPLQRFFLMPHEGDGRFLASGVPTFPHWKDTFCETEFLSGGVTFWRADVLRANQFDERLAGYGHGDDVDVSYRVSRQYKLFYEPRARCEADFAAPGKDAGRKYRRAWIQNFYYLAQKNGVSLPAYAWCVAGHFVRDAVCGDLSRLRGDFEGAWNVLRGRIDTVQGYAEFRAGLGSRRGSENANERSSTTENVGHDGQQVEDSHAPATLPGEASR